MCDHVCAYMCVSVITTTQKNHHTSAEQKQMNKMRMPGQEMKAELHEKQSGKKANLKLSEMKSLIIHMKHMKTSGENIPSRIDWVENSVRPGGQRRETGSDGYGK